MILGDGIVKILRATNTAGNGHKPKYTYTEICKSYYGEKTVGISRYYAAKGNNDNIDMLVQIQHNRSIRPATDYAEIEGEYYRITQLQQVRDNDGLLMTDLTLERIENLE